MLGMAESRITIEVPNGAELESLAKNLTLLVTEIEETMVRGEPEDEEQLITDVWVGIVLTLLVLSCAASMCACMLYHRFQLWKRRVLQARTDNEANFESADGESLPSYTIVSGLPSYDEALQQLKIVREKQARQKQAEASVGDWSPHTPPTPMAKLSVTDLFQLYMAAGAVPNQALPPTSAEITTENKS